MGQSHVRVPPELPAFLNAERLAADVAAIYAGGKNVELSSTEHTLVLDADAVAKGKQKDLDELGIAKTAREEKLRARKSSQDDERMAALYRQHVLKEQAPPPVIKIAGLGGTKKPEV